MLTMFNPPHPGGTLREIVLPALNLTCSEAARQLGMNPDDLERILNEQAPVTADVALRIEVWLGIENGGSASVWLGVQQDYDLWNARQTLKDEPKDVAKRDTLTLANR